MRVDTILVIMGVFGCALYLLVTLSGKYEPESGPVYHYEPKEYEPEKPAWAGQFLGERDACLPPAGKTVYSVKEALADPASVINLELVGGTVNFPETLTSCVNLRSIFIKGVKMPNPQSDFKVMSSLPSLTHLTITLVPLREIPAEIEGFKKLEVCKILAAKITTVPDEIARLPKLWYLNLRNCRRLSSLTDSLVHMQQLHYLGFAGTSMTEVPESVSKLKHLITLEANACKINRLPTSMQEMQWLEALNLGANALDSLPDDIGLCKELRDVGLGGNRLSKLPASMINLRQLVFCSLKGNQFEKFPMELANSKIYAICIEDNPLREIPCEVIQMSHLARIVCDTLLVNPEDLACIRRANTKLEVH